MRTDKRHFENILWHLIRKLKVSADTGCRSDGGQNIFKQFGEQIAKELKKMSSPTLGRIVGLGEAIDGSGQTGEIPMAIVVPKEFCLNIERSGQSTLLQLALATVVAGMWGVLTAKAYKIKRDEEREWEEDINDVWETPTMSPTGCYIGQATLEIE